MWERDSQKFPETRYLRFVEQNRMNAMSEYYPAVLWSASIGFSIWLALEKDRNWMVWGVLSLFLGPIALIAIAGMPKAAEPLPNDSEELAPDAEAWNPRSGPPPR